MKLFVKLMALIVVLAVAGPFFIKGPDGRPLMEIGEVAASIKRQWNAMVVDAGRRVGNEDAGKVEVYRWQDADGNWHFSDEENPRGESELIKVDPYASRMDPFVATPPPEPEQRAGGTAGADPGVSVPLPLTVSPGEARQLIEDAGNIQEDLEERARDIDERSR